MSAAECIPEKNRIDAMPKGPAPIFWIGSFSPFNGIFRQSAWHGCCKSPPAYLEENFHDETCDGCGRRAGGGPGFGSAVEAGERRRFVQLLLFQPEPVRVLGGV